MMNHTIPKPLVWVVTVALIAAGGLLTYQSFVIMEIRFHLSRKPIKTEPPYFSLLPEDSKIKLSKMQFDWRTPTSSPLGFDEILDSNSGLVRRTKFDWLGVPTHAEDITVSPETIDAYVTEAAKKLILMFGPEASK